MEKIEYLESYKIKPDAKSIDINDFEEGDFVHKKGRYSYDGEDHYGKSTGWEDVDYDTVYKINFDITMYKDNDRIRDSNIFFGSKEFMIDHINEYSKKSSMFSISNIDYIFYKPESIEIIQTPNTYLYLCDTEGCDNKYSTYKDRLIKNDKQVSMKIMKDGTHKCYQCCNIGKYLPDVKFNLECNSQQILDKLLKILRKNSWNVTREDDAVVIGMILRDKVNYVVDMIAELNKKAKFDFRFDRKEKFYKPEKSEINYHYIMKK